MNILSGHANHVTITLFRTLFFWAWCSGMYRLVRSGGSTAALRISAEAFQDHFRSLGRTRNNNGQYSEPYIDGLGLGLMITISAPVYHPDGSLVGVVATDVLLPEIVNIASQFDTALSYAFVMDRMGQALVHPLAPKQVCSHSN